MVTEERSRPLLEPSTAIRLIWRAAYGNKLTDWCEWIGSVCGDCLKWMVCLLHIRDEVFLRWLLLALLLLFFVQWPSSFLSRTQLSLLFKHKHDNKNFIWNHFTMGHKMDLCTFYRGQMHIFWASVCHSACKNAIKWLSTNVNYQELFWIIASFESVMTLRLWSSVGPNSILVFMMMITFVHISIILR